MGIVWIGEVLSTGTEYYLSGFTTSGIGGVSPVFRPPRAVAIEYRGYVFFFQAEDGIRDKLVTGVQTCALPIYSSTRLFGRGVLSGVGVRRALSVAIRLFSKSTRSLRMTDFWPFSSMNWTTLSLKIGRASCRERVEIVGVAWLVINKGQGAVLTQ